MAWGAACAFAALAACVTTVEPVGRPRLVNNPGKRTVVFRGPDGAVTRDASFDVSLEPLPEVRTDGFLLPLLRPDASWVAWQSSSNADWPTLLAQPQATRALRSAVSGRPLAGGASWDRPESLLLGRMATAEGALVEAPRADGSRWIGLVPWDGTPPAWLVQDEFVNAFAAMGPRGERAWCRRMTSQPDFELVVDRPEGRLEFPRRTGESWMMPVVARDGVYACSVRDGILELAFLPIRAGQALTRSEAEPAMLRKTISVRATARTAFQTMIACTPDGAASDSGLLFFHPELRRMAIWNPTQDTMTLLAADSVAGWMQPDGSALLTLRDRLVMQDVPPEPGMAPLQLLPGMWIVRGRDGADEVLLGPEQDRCRISRLRGIQPDTGAPRN